MKTRHLTRRTLRKNTGFSWCRIPSNEEQPLQYRLFIRDSAGRSHVEMATMWPADLARGEAYIARRVRAMKAQLRWRVDQLEFARLGLQDTAPQPELAA